ncbi:FtsB family cell division protein, partial [Ornithinicoccus halotolerans]|uniref:FtsB family cell division protein n=1 Tax=Ornithinicoccus halotolerans TaxID=1748220 RepID=UPI001295471F
TRPAPATPARPSGRGGSGRPTQIWRLGVLVLLLGFIALFLTPTLRGYLEERAHINELRAEIRAEQQQIADLETELEQWEDPAFIERQARERLRFVREGETAFTVLDDTGEQLTEPVPGMASVTHDVAEHRPWYGQVWESVRSANEGVTEDDGGQR